MFVVAAVARDGLDSADKASAWFEEVAVAFEFLDDFFHFGFGDVFLGGCLDEVFEGDVFADALFKLLHEFFNDDDFVSFAGGHVGGDAVDVVRAGFFVVGDEAEAVVEEFDGAFGVFFGDFVGKAQSRACFAKPHKTFELSCADGDAFGAVVAGGAAHFEVVFAEFVDGFVGEFWEAFLAAVGEVFSEELCVELGV